MLHFKNTCLYNKRQRGINPQSSVHKIYQQFMDKTGLCITIQHVKSFEVKKLNPCSVKVNPFTKKRYLRERFLIRYERTEKEDRQVNSFQICLNLGSWYLQLCLDSLSSESPKARGKMAVLCIIHAGLDKAGYILTAIDILIFFKFNSRLPMLCTVSFPLHTCLIGLGSGKTKILLSLGVTFFLFLTVVDILFCFCKDKILLQSL